MINISILLLTHPSLRFNYWDKADEIELWLEENIPTAIFSASTYVWRFYIDFINQEDLMFFKLIFANRLDIKIESQEENY